MSLDDAIAFARRMRGERRRPAFGWDSLTPTELQVVDGVVDGLTNPQIATKLLMGRETVKTHLSNVYSKLSVTNRSQLAVAASSREAR
jgi:DNA-binding NarL/FixJ family response regulator